jgi:hypothetical protein
MNRGHMSEVLNTFKNAPTGNRTDTSQKEKKKEEKLIRTELYFSHAPNMKN